jgi:hypothetical protein
VRPIGVGEVPRRIIAKAILRTIGKDIEEAAGPLQVCAGQDGGCEAAVHAMRAIFQDADTEGCLLVDASNAFNSLNRRAALHNVSVLCPPLSPVLINTYRAPVRMIVAGSGEISSTEGTTQGDPPAMAMYALATVPLIHLLSYSSPDVKQAWYADDATGAGSCEKLRQWWDEIMRLGPAYGYHPNSSKTYLIVKEEHESKAKELFADTDVHITINGKRHLGAAIGAKSFTEEYVSRLMRSRAYQQLPSPNLMWPTLLSCMASPVTGRTSQGLFLRYKTCSSHLRQLFTSISSQHSLAEKLALLWNETS